MTRDEILAGLKDRLAKVTDLDESKHEADLGVAAATVHADVDALLARLRPAESAIVPFTLVVGTQHIAVQLRVARDVVAHVDGQPEAAPSFHWD